MPSREGEAHDDEQHDDEQKRTASTTTDSAAGRKRGGPADGWRAARTHDDGEPHGLPVILRRAEPPLVRDVGNRPEPTPMDTGAVVYRSPESNRGRSDSAAAGHNTSRPAVEHRGSLCSPGNASPIIGSSRSLMRERIPMDSIGADTMTLPRACS